MAYYNNGKWNGPRELTMSTVKKNASYSFLEKLNALPILETLEEIDISKIHSSYTQCSLRKAPSEGRIVVNLLGTPGSGKKAQAKFLHSNYGWNHFSTKDLFRNEIANATDLGDQILFHYQKTGDYSYVPDEITLGIMAKKFILENCKKGFILDGFPKTKLQSKALCTIFLRSNDLHIPILLKFNEEPTDSYLTFRFVCKNCRLQFKKNDPLKEFRRCLHCNDSLKSCDDYATKEEIGRKSELFYENIQDVVEVLSKRDPIYVLHLDNSKNPKKILVVINILIQKELQKHFSR